MNKKQRIYLTGVGGQGTLTTTKLLAQIILDQGISVIAGEIHGMAQRGGVVESTIMTGGWKSPSIQEGEADIILGFEPLETIRAIKYLAPHGAVFTSSDFIHPPSLHGTRDTPLPSLEEIKQRLRQYTNQLWVVPLKDIGLAAGSLQSGNMALLTTLCFSGLLPVSVEALTEGIKKYLPAQLRDVNLQATTLCLEYLSAASTQTTQRH